MVAPPGGMQERTKDLWQTHRCGRAGRSHSACRAGGRTGAGTQPHRPERRRPGLARRPPPYRNDRGDRRYRDRDRDGIPDRFDRHDNRRRHWGPDNRYGYRDQPRCWSETRWDRWRGARYRVRVCR
jgi:hypothetical protein